MKRKPNSVGGGSKTNLNGLSFEGRMDMREAIRKNGKYYLDENDQIIKKKIVIAKYFEKNGLYKKYLKPLGIDYKKILSRQLLPDAALLVDNNLYIIEKKYQSGSGSVDEKLQTCDFKKKQYEKLLKPLNIKVHYYYVLSSWFNSPKNKDVFAYIESVGCKYFIENLPFKEIGL